MVVPSASAASKKRKAADDASPSKSASSQSLQHPPKQQPVSDDAGGGDQKAATTKRGGKEGDATAAVVTTTTRTTRSSAASLSSTTPSASTSLSRKNSSSNSSSKNANRHNSATTTTSSTTAATAAANNKGRKQAKVTTTTTTTTTTNTTDSQLAQAQQSFKTYSVDQFNREALHKDIEYTPLTLEDIHRRIQGLCHQVPLVPPSGFRRSNASCSEQQEEKEDKEKATAKKTAASPVPSEQRLPQPQEPCQYDKKELRDWATALQTVIEEFHLLVVCVSPATYAWGTDRSGAADQNLGLLSTELIRSQEQINARVSPLLSNVLAPVVALLTDQTVTTKNERGEEVKQNYFVTTVEDPDYVDLAHVILARNANLLRQVVLANLDKLLRSIQDFLTAQTKDSQHDSRGFVY